MTLEASKLSAHFLETPMTAAFIIALNPTGRVAMTRDMELIRLIATRIQERRDLKHRPVEIDGYEDWIVARHLELMLDAALIDAVKLESLDQPYPTILVKDLSSAGHDFAAAVGNETVWAKMKQTFTSTEFVKLPLVVVKDVGVALLGHWAKSKLGI